MKNPKRSPSDACVQINRARTGSLVDAKGNPLTMNNLRYLITLREQALSWVEAIDAEIARVTPRFDVSELIKRDTL